MATIAISNLHPIGSSLFSDKETFLNELSDEQAGLTYGGLFKYPSTALCVPRIPSRLYAATVGLTPPYIQLE